MSLPGWYPDPAGGSQPYRYWDGQAWSSATTSDPNSAPPSNNQISNKATRDKQGGFNWGLLAVIAAGIVAFGLVIWLIFSGGASSHNSDSVPEDTNSAAPTVSGWDESSTPSPPPTQASLTDCPTTTNSDNSDQGDGSRLHGGNISVEKIPEWDQNGSMFLQWVSDIHSQDQPIRPGWMSNLMVGQLNASDGFNNMQVAADQTMQCIASSGYYISFTGRTDIRNEAYKVGDFDAWRLTAEVHISSITMPEIEGDVVDVIVVDTGDPERLGLYISCVTIGDDTTASQVEKALATLKVER